jgi:hypothetical protein
MCVVVFFMLTCLSAQGQNTKGDRPSGNRENRFRTGTKKKKSPTTARRVRSRSKSPANRGSQTPRSASRRGERAGKPIRPVYSTKPSSEKKKAWRGDISGRRIRTKSKSSTSTYVHPQYGVKRRVRETEGARNVYPQSGRYVGGYSKKAPDRKPVYSNQTVYTRKPPRNTERNASAAKRVRKVTPRSATRNYVSSKSINVYARFKRPKKKGERAVTTDIAGRKLRTRNYQTRGPGLVPAIVHPSQKRKRLGDRPYSGTNYSGYQSVSRSGRAWRGDLAHNRLRFRGRSSKRSTEGSPSYTGQIRTQSPRTRGGVGGGVLSRSGRKRTDTTPVPVKGPGLGGQIAGYRGKMRQSRGANRDQGESFSGVLKARRPAKGGGSRSGKGWNNSGTPLQVRTPRSGVDVGGFRGRTKVGGRTMRDQGEMYSGSIKRRRAGKGGGSVSGRLWNNRQSPLPSGPQGVDIGAIPERLRRRKQLSRADQGEEFAGTIKSRRPLKGGGSVSGKIWNNRESPLPSNNQRGADISAIPARLRRKRTVQVDQGEEFTGFTKAKRPVKGGGSVSGTLWNNKETAIQVKAPPESARRAMEYSGNKKVNLMRPRFRDQGEEYTGAIKRSRGSYVQNDKAAEESMKKRKPSKSTNEVNGLQVRVQRRDYVKNKNSAEDALMKLKPTKATNDVGNLQVKVKQYRYVRNGSSARDALKVREPGKAFARSTDYQGNIKMRKYAFFEKNRGRYPDSRFIKTNKNNVDGERDMLTNFKLWWARLFKKQESQPEHLKDKGRKPRYDSGEQGMWYD